MLVKIITAFALWQSILEIRSEDDVPFIRVHDGTLVGSHRQTLNGNTYIAFEGIPYATPPVDRLRFLDPQSAASWNGVRNATFVRNICPQPQNNIILGAEDCLYINVYLPKGVLDMILDPSQELKNVLVYIHGGAYSFFSGNTVGPQYFFDHEEDVIIVTFNYRLGILGFFSLGDDVIPGNNGLKDQVLALKWVQKNIECFGGDPNKVTIAGFSAGAASVQLHMLSSASKGLFQRAISTSGTALSPWAISRNVVKKSTEIAAKLGCPTMSSNQILKCLQALPMEKIAAAIVPYYTFGYTPISPFGPVVEPCRPNAFLSSHPLHLMTEIQHGDAIPWLISMNKDEGLFPGAGIISDPQHMLNVTINWRYLFESILSLDYSLPHHLQPYSAQKIKEYYFGNDLISYNNTPIFVKMLTERLFTNGIEQAAKLQAAKCAAAVYMYQFNYRGQHSTTEAFTNTSINFGVSHGDDLLLYVLYDSIFKPLETQTYMDHEMTKTMVKIWSSFVKTGSPSISNEQWPPLSCKERKLTYLAINSPTISVINEVSVLGSQSFWDTLPFFPFDGYNKFCFTYF